MRFDILVNSEGPHAHVRIHEPYCEMQRLGEDCRLLRLPMQLCKLRPQSIVIWQRPCPTSIDEQVRVVRYLREKGCILITEWDDHVGLFPESVRKRIEKTGGAALRHCHAVQTSSARLERELWNYNEFVYVLGNYIRRCPPLNKVKHQRPLHKRIFIGNQNRVEEHIRISRLLRAWTESDPSVELIVVGEKVLSNELGGRCTSYPTLDYMSYRRLLASCHVALLPLEDNLPNNCKTPIKWLEASAESVACVAGPGLYGDKIDNGVTGLMVKTVEETVRVARKIADDDNVRLAIVKEAHARVNTQYNLRGNMQKRIRLYRKLWDKRAYLDQRLAERFPDKYVY